LVGRRATLRWGDRNRTGDVQLGKPATSSEPESGVNAVMALIRACPGPSSRWTSVLVSENYRNGSFGSMTVVAIPAAQDAP
jgi:hypothetical protein